VLCASWRARDAQGFVDPYQVLEARASGAGGVLLIVRMVERARLVAMLDEAAAQGLFVLLEAFDADDLAIAADLATERHGRDEQVLMGLNCRDLQTLQIDFAGSSGCGTLPEAGRSSRSGIVTPDDAATVASLDIGWRWSGRP
jgi:indole-3-glycerol phosphate synthase